MELFLIRHLPTHWNEKGKLQGRKDIPIKRITERSFAKINQIKSELSNISISHCFSSPLKRATQTADEYGYKNPTIDNRIIEFDFGPYEGKPKKEMLSDIGSIWYDNVEKLNLGEQFSDFKTRVDAFIDEKKSLDKALLFSHGFVIRYLLSQHRYDDLTRLNHIEAQNNHLYHIQV